MCGYRNPFARTQSRYRHIDLKLIPELQDVLADYRLPLPAIATPPELRNSTSKKSSDRGQMLAVPACDRPFVHIFLIQESMRIDTLEAVIDSISKAVEDMHPDINFLLLSYSHRLGVYHFPEDDSISGTVGPTVQYIHFTSGPTVQSVNNNNNNSRKIFEGHTLQEMIPIEQVSLMFPLQHVVDFASAIYRVGDFRNGLRLALKSILDAFASDSSGLVDDFLPKVMHYIFSSIHDIHFNPLFLSLIHRTF